MANDGNGTCKLELGRQASTQGRAENQSHLPGRVRPRVGGRDQDVRLETRGDMVKTKACLELIGRPDTGALSE